MKYLILILLLTACAKTEIEDCDCGYIYSVIKKCPDYTYYFWEDECSGRSNMIKWHNAIPLDWDTGTYICKLQEVYFNEY